MKWTWTSLDLAFHLVPSLNQNKLCGIAYVRSRIITSGYHLLICPAYLHIWTNGHEYHDPMRTMQPQEVSLLYNYVKRSEVFYSAIMGHDHNGTAK